MKRIVVGITGGIAVYKVVSLVSELVQNGYEVKVIMTKAATSFVTPLTLQVISRNKVYVDIFQEDDPKVISHIALADFADLIVVAPATADIIAKYAFGIADNLLTTTLLAATSPVLFVPAMNTKMYENIVVRQNISLLKARGVYFIEPEYGNLACGYVGLGRMAEVAKILNFINSYFSSDNRLKNKEVLVTAGPTVEPIDPVRYISNYSSGKMGFFLAAAFALKGANVILISGPVNLATPLKVKRFNVWTTKEMNSLVLEHLPKANIICQVAAVVDYKPALVYKEKIKKSDEFLNLKLEKNIDIALNIGRKKKDKQFFVGFAAETSNIEENAIKKLQAKNMDLIVANKVDSKDSGFFTDTNIVTVYDKNGKVVSFPKLSKEEVARRLVELIGERL